MALFNSNLIILIMNILFVCLIYLLLACVNLSFALDSKNKNRAIHWIGFGFGLGVMTAQIINYFQQ